MTGPDAQALYQAFHAGPTAEELIRYLPDLADRTAAQLAELAREPTPERCERMQIELDGTRQLVTRLRGALLRDEGNEDGHQ